jgi:YbbR domain-containing protein
VTWLRTAGLRLSLAVGLGFALWIFVSYTETPDRLTHFRDLPVAIEELPPGLVIVDQNGLPNATLPTISVTLRSIGETTVTPSSNDIQAYVDLADVRPGENSVPVGARVTVPGRKPEVSDIEPDYLSIRVEQIITNTVPLTIEVQGSVPFSYESQPPSLTLNNQPISSVLVRGPQSRVERVVMVRATVNIDGRTASYNSPRPLVAVGADNQEVEGVTIEPSSVNVRVPIVSSAGIKRVPVVPQVTGEPASGYVVSQLAVDPQFVRLVGGATALEAVSSVSTDPVEIQGANTTITRTVRLRQPSLTSLLAGEPISATVSVTIMPISRPFQVTLPVPIEVVDVASGLLQSVNPTTIQVSVSGTAQQLGSLNAQQIIARISMQGQGAGVYSIRPTIILPQGLTLTAEPPEVTVVLRAPVVPTPDDNNAEPTVTPTTPGEEPTPQPPPNTPTPVPPTPSGEQPPPTETPAPPPPPDDPAASPTTETQGEEEAPPTST